MNLYYQKILFILSGLFFFLTACSSPVTNSTTVTPVARLTDATVTISSQIESTPTPQPPSSTTTPKAPTPTPSSICNNELIKPPSISQFPSLDAKGAIAFSSDGLRLVFPETNARAAIHPLSELELDGVDRAFAWSPDGTRIAFLYTDLVPEDCANGYLLLADLTKGEVRPLTTQPGRFGPPVWSPDGEWIASVTGVGELEILRPSDNTTRILSNAARPGVAPAWLDSAHILFARSNPAQGITELVRQPVDQSPPKVLLESSSALSVFAYEAKRERIAFYDGALRIVDLTSGQTDSLGTEPSEFLQWSPDGMYLIGREGLAGINLVALEREPKISQLPILGIIGASQAWAPDSQRFAFLMGSDGGDGETKIGIYSILQGLIKLPVQVEPPFAVAWNIK